MRLYLAGPMTGYPLWNFPAFDDATRELRAVGHDVVSPAEIDRALGFDPATSDLPEGFYETAMRRDIEALLTVEAVALLPGWRASKGASFELAVANMLGLPGFEVTDDGLVTLSETILEEAQRLVHGPRHADYGHPADDFARTGRMWGAILGIDDVPPETVGLCMAALKLSREVHRPKRDNLVDLAGYAATVAMIHDPG